VILAYNTKLSLANKFLEFIEETIQGIKGRTLVMGDFNIDMLCNNPTQAKCKSLLGSYGYFQCNRSIPTRVTAGSATLIDHIYSNDEYREHIVYNVQDDFSDHNVLLLRVKGSKSHVAYGKKTLKKLKVNCDKSISYFKHNPGELDSLDVNVCYEQLENYL